jgi:hypothetical protein
LQSNQLFDFVFYLNCFFAYYRCFNLENTLSKYSTAAKVASVKATPETNTWATSYCGSQAARAQNVRFTHISTALFSTVNDDNPNSDAQLLSAQT